MRERIHPMRTGARELHVTARTVQPPLEHAAMHLFEVPIALARRRRQASDVMTDDTAARQLIGRERERRTVFRRRSGRT
jgi:hypothetical protein